MFGKNLDKIKSDQWTIFRIITAVKRRYHRLGDQCKKWTIPFRMSKRYKKAKLIDARKESILFWVPGGMSGMLDVEAAIAAALRLRGHSVHAIICGGVLRACVKREIKDGIPVSSWSKACKECTRQTSAVLKKMAISYSFIGDYVSETELEYLWQKTDNISYANVDDFVFFDINVGKNAKSAIIRYLQGCDLSGHEEIVREYVYSALISASASKKVLDTVKPSQMVTSHGTYVDWGPALQLAVSREVPVTAWMASYLKAHFYFRKVEDIRRIDFHNMSIVAWDGIKKSELVTAQNEQLDKFMFERYFQHISFDMKKLMNYVGDSESFRNKYKLDSQKPVWGIMAHINWDAVCDYSPMAYNTFDDWIVDTIYQIANITDVNWLIKIHPAESWDNPSSGVESLIKRHFPKLPDHIQVISAEEKISPLDFFNLVDGGVTVYGTSGLELALLGKPVILAGEAHYGGRGFTYDGLTQQSYKQLLARAKELGRLTDEQKQLARRYAYCYFIARQIPLEVVHNPASEWWEFQNNKTHLLLPGRDPFIDFICERIIDGTDFIMDEELIRLAQNSAVKQS